MTTETLSKVIGIRLPQGILDTYEEEAERTSQKVASLIRRDLVRLFAGENATSGSDNARYSRPDAAKGQAPAEITPDGDSGPPARSERESGAA